MKSISKVENKRGLGILELEEPKFVSEEDVLVEVDAVSICGTDLHIYEWDDWARNRIKIPRVLGHEGTGRIIKIGSKVKGLHEGQRVSFESHIPCFRCYQCKTGRPHICSDLKILGIDVDGLFRKYVVVPHFIVIPNDLDYDEAALLEPLGNAFHALSKVDIRGKYVGILGDGPIAMFLFYFAQKFGPAKIFLVGANNYRIDFAKKINYSNHPILNYFEDNILQVIKDQTNGRMLDIVFEMAGSKNTVELGIELLSMGGKLIAFGILPSKIEIDYNQLIFKSIDIISVNGRILFDSWFVMLDTIKKGELRKFITYEVEFTNYQEAFELLLRKEALKIIIKI
ncbi:MAG: alcohol dehydrogenase catalytic domain-containing protein [Candidatus Calescibacterium sp.]|nr:alcohol dehydrogenase catalytic domain-containing protein [Candidatus Calescibacterium sp.]MCX7972421.1 alcohol dehydrogenase catalytic domain-containing protein [bacterium]MDW8195688.1 alcohol dehydrogenase catalytic domain-containing protein [Candidatus Calescibacterium sp.]